MRTRGRVPAPFAAFMSSPSSTWLAHDAHVVPGNLAIADRQFEPAVARVGELAGVLEPVDLPDLRDDPAAAEAGHVGHVELEVEVLGWCDPGQLVAHPVEAVQLTPRGDPLDVGR